MKFKEFRNKMEQTFEGKFGASSCVVTHRRGLGQYIVVDCHLAETMNECPNHIPANDMMHVCFAIELPDDWKTENDLPEKLTMENWESQIKIKPDSPHLFCSSKRVMYRRVQGGAEKLVAAFGRYVDRLYNAVKEEYESENLLDFDMQLITNKQYFS